MTTHSHDRRTFLVAGASAMIGLALRPVNAQSPRPAGMTLAQASALLRRKAVSSLELTRACLERIATYNPSLNAFITVTMEGALAAARQMDAESRRGNWRVNARSGKQVPIYRGRIPSFRRPVDQAQRPQRSQPKAPQGR